MCHNFGKRNFGTGIYKFNTITVGIIFGNSPLQYNVQNFIYINVNFSKRLFIFETKKP